MGKGASLFNRKKTGNMFFNDVFNICLDFIDVTEFEEDEGKGFMQSILLSMTIMEVGQLWCGMASAGAGGLNWLYTQIRLYAWAVGDHYILLDDNARPQTARVDQDYLQKDSIVRLDWSACSPTWSHRAYVEWFAGTHFSPSGTTKEASKS